MSGSQLASFNKMPGGSGGYPPRTRHFSPIPYYQALPGVAVPKRKFCTRAPKILFLSAFYQLTKKPKIFALLGVQLEVCPRATRLIILENLKKAQDSSACLHVDKNQSSTEDFYTSITEAVKLRDRGIVSVEHESQVFIDDSGEVRSIADYMDCQVLEDRE